MSPRGTSLKEELGVSLIDLRLSESADVLSRTVVFQAGPEL